MHSCIHILYLIHFKYKSYNHIAQNMLQSNLSTQVVIIICSAIAMGGMGVLGHVQAQQQKYNPALIPSLSVVASAFLLNMLISASSETTVQHFHWPTGIVLLLILIGCNYLSSPTKSSLRLNIISRNHTLSKEDVLHRWNTSVDQTSMMLYFGEDELYHDVLRKQLTEEINKSQIINKNQDKNQDKNNPTHHKELILNVVYDKTIEEGDTTNQLPIVSFIQHVLGTEYVVHSEVNKAKGVSIGLAIAVFINFMMDGLLAGNEISFPKSSSHSRNIFQVGYMKLNNVFGFIFDNLILMLILGYQFARSAMNIQQQSLAICAIVAGFVVSMCLGMFTSISSSINTNMAETIVFVVIAYTVFVELLPNTMQFEDFYGRDIELNNDEDPYVLTHPSFYMSNYTQSIMPLMLFGVYFAYRGLMQYVE